MGDQSTASRRYPIAFVAIVLIGLGLRILSSRGGLWLDEAWSARLARDAGTPIGIFLNINHDNNHHLNSLWLQFVGYGAPPMLARALSIGTGTIAIAVAGLIGARRGHAAALTTALLFAIAPIMVTMGSEARGYAPMSLAFLAAILLVDRLLSGHPAERTPFRLALCAGLGAFAQLTLLSGWVALTGWVFFALWRRHGLKQSIGDTLRLFWPSFAALAIVLGVIFGAAYASMTGFQFGRYDPFAILLFLHALTEMTAFTLGVPWQSFWLLVAVAIAVIVARQFGVVRLAFYRLAILAFPITLAMLHAGNVGHPRYYLIASIAMLILAGELIGLAFAAHRRWQYLGGLALAAMALGSIADDVALIRNQRGDPDPAIAAMRAIAPAGATILLDRDTELAMVEYAAAEKHYSLTIVQNGCQPAAFLFADRFKGETFPGTIDRCGGHYVPIAAATANGLSGTHWTLYRRQPS